MNILPSVFHQTVAVRSDAEVCSNLFYQLAVVISFGRCDHIAAVVEVGVSVCGNLFWSLHNLDALPWMLSQSTTATTNSAAVVGFLAQTASEHSLFSFAKVLAFAHTN